MKAYTIAYPLTLYIEVEAETAEEANHAGWQMTIEDAFDAFSSFSLNEPGPHIVEKRQPRPKLPEADA